MNLQFENIETGNQESSFHYFLRETDRFEPYWHFHPELELTLIKQGQGVRFVGDNIGNFHDNDLVLLGENLPHQWVTSSDVPARIQVAHVFQFSKTLFNGFPELKMLRNLFEEASRGLHFFAPKPSLLVKFEMAATLLPAERLVVLLQILNEMALDNKRETLTDSRLIVNQRTKRQQNKVSEVISFLLENYAQQITLNQIADQNQMTPPSFSRWFKQATGKSFISYLNALRIEKACELLLTSGFPIIDISHKCGFESLSNFNRNFKRIKHTAPRAYRNERR